MRSSDRGLPPLPYRGVFEEIEMIDPQRVDVHQHVVPPVYAEQPSGSGGHPSATSRHSGARECHRLRPRTCAPPSEVGDAYFGANPVTFRVSHLIESQLRLGIEEV
jgi:hypothetical protein